VISSPHAALLPADSDLHNDQVSYDPERHHWRPLTVGAVSELLAPCTGQWWLSGGCALDHWLGRTTRPHGDIDVSVLRRDWRDLICRLPAGLEPFAAMSGRLLPLAQHADNPELHNIWVRTTGTADWVLQVNIEVGDRDRWRYRRRPAISRPWAQAVADVHGVPTVNPAVQLLWKSMRPEATDDADLAVTAPDLSEADRRWLDGAIRLAHPQSPWASRSISATTDMRQ